MTRLLLGIALLIAAAPAAAATERSTTHMHGQRYCEYFALKGQFPDLKADVWNTYGLNKCPSAQWKASDPAGIAKDLGALGVVLNGPRYWLVDSARIALPRGFGQVRTFPNGLKFRKLTTLDVPIKNGAISSAPYNETTVNRSNSFTWSRRFPVFELVSPAGRVYVMQSFSHIVDTKLAIGDLPKLGSRLKLPAGWRYRQQHLKRDLTLTTKGRATVLQDDLQDTYQLVTRR